MNDSTVQTKLIYASQESGGGLTHVNSRFIPDLNWYLVVQQDETRALAPLTRVLLLNAFIAIAATAMALTLVWFAANRYHRRLEHMAITDALTGLANRSHGEVFFGNAIEHANKNHEPLSVLVVDIDHFKRINDTYGHLAGDRVIVEFSQRLQRSVRRNDRVIRWGGEEFLVVLPNYDLRAALALAETIRSESSSQPFVPGEPAIGSSAASHQSELLVTVSIGVAKWDGEESATALFSRADRALIQAKQDGRDRIHTAA